MSQTLLEMAKDLVLAQIQAKMLPPEDMHQALQHTYAMKRTPSSRQKRARIKIDCYRFEPKYTAAGV